jgi:hypothetical protein
MPQMKGTTTERALTNVSLMYKNEAISFIADKLSPAVQVVKDVASIYSYGAENLRITNNIKSRGGKSNYVDWSISKATHYDIEDHALHTYIPRQDYDNAEKPINVKIDTTEIITEMLMVAKEYSLAAAMQDVTVMTNNTTLSGTDQWSDYTNSDPIGDILTGINAVKSASGKLPNTLVLAWDTYLKLMYHPKIKDMFPGAATITAKMLTDGLAQIFPMIKEVVVGMAQYNSSNEGASLDLAEIWTKTAIVAYIEKNPKLKSRSLSFTYQKGTPRNVEFVPKNASDSELVSRNADFLQVTDSYDQVIVDVNCGYLIKNAIA